MVGLQSAMEVPFLGNGVREREEKDNNDRNYRLDLVATDPINNCVVELDVSVFSPLAASHINGSPPAGDIISSKLDRYSVSARERGHFFRPFTINTFGKLSKGAREWLNNVAQVWMDSELPSKPQTLGEAQRLVFAHFYCGFQRAMGDFFQSCTTTKFRLN